MSTLMDFSRKITINVFSTFPQTRVSFNKYFSIIFEEYLKYTELVDVKIFDCK